MRGLWVELRHRRREPMTAAAPEEEETPAAQ
jgi:hypothetical protein